SPIREPARRRSALAPTGRFNADLSPPSASGRGQGRGLSSLSGIHGCARAWTTAAVAKPGGLSPCPPAGLVTPWWGASWGGCELPHRCERAVLFRSTGQPDRRRGDPHDVSVSVSGQFLHQHKLTVQIALSQDGVETALETCITLSLHCRWARQGSAYQ